MSSLSLNLPLISEYEILLPRCPPGLSALPAQLRQIEHCALTCLGFGLGLQPSHRVHDWPPVVGCTTPALPLSRLQILLAGEVLEGRTLALHVLSLPLTKMPVSLHCSLVAADTAAVLWEGMASGGPGKQQEFKFSKPVADVPAETRAVFRTADGASATIAPVVAASEASNDKTWARSGKLGDALVTQVLLKKQASGLWKIKKLVVTTPAGPAPDTAAPVRPPRITCPDEEAGDEMLMCARYQASKTAAARSWAYTLTPLVAGTGNSRTWSPSWTPVWCPWTTKTTV